MVLGIKGKNRRSGTVQIDYKIQIQEIKPWPPSKSLRSLHSVFIEWKKNNGVNNTPGSTKLVSPSLGSVIGEGRIEFNESFRLSTTLFQKNCLEFNLYEPRKENSSKGQLLGTCIVDLADYGILKETQRISIPMNCKRSYRNTDQPLLFIKIQPIEKSNSLKERFSKEVMENSSDSVSTLVNEEYAEIASFTDDDDVSSYSSLTEVSTSFESSGFTPKVEKEPDTPSTERVGATELKSEKLKNVKSMRSPADSTKNNGLLGSNHHAEVKDNRIFGNAEKSGGNINSIEKRDVKIYPKEAKNATLEGKIENLEKKIKMLEGELREAAAIESALYSVVAEHGSSMSKVHTPARRLARLYLHACRENIQGRKFGAAKSSVSGLVLVAKACGNDVPRLTFWLSNVVVLRTIISKSSKDHVPSIPTGINRRRKTEGDGKIVSSQRLKGFYLGKNENKALGYESFGNWDDPQVFLSALEKVEAWIFSRVVESIWWQTLTPHMQHVDTKLTKKEVASASSKSYRRKSSSCDQEQGNLSLDIWKNAFREACERICPIRAGGHECGCLPMLPRLIMEQCVERLDVVMFNAILRKSADEIPTDPISDAISDPKVVPIPPGKSSFGAGAQLKTVIGNWSRWLSALVDMDEDDSLDDNEERQKTSLKSFTLLNALSDLLMLPKDMLLSASIRNEVCHMFSAQLIKKILEMFVPDEFCPDHVPATVLEALDSENDMEGEKDSVNNFPYIAAPIFYSPPPETCIASIIGEKGSKSKLRRNRSSVIRKSYTSDDELNELKSPLASILFNGSPSSTVSTKSSSKSKETRNESPFRYELLRDVWINSE